MNVYRLKLPLWLGAGLFGAAACAVVLWAGCWPPASGSPGPSGSAPADSGFEQPLRSGRPLADYQAVWQRNVRIQLVKPPPPPPPPPAAPPPRLNLKLAATMIEPGFTRATIVDAAGKSHLTQVGDTIGGVRIKTISEGSVVVVFAGREQTLRVERSASR